MKLEFVPAIGPGVEKAVGFGGVFLVHHKEDGSVLYLMRHGNALCPINKERAERVFECELPDEARRQAQKWEDKIVANAHLLFRRME